MKSDRHKLYEHLRNKHPSLIYDGFSFALDDNSLYIVFDFSLENGPHFRPELVLHGLKATKADILEDSLIRNIIFNMGMVELISYWKAACPPEIVVRAGGLTDDQLAWWKKLFWHGLGEFFYDNGVNPGADFVNIVSTGEKYIPVRGISAGKGVLVPVGGGKDSALSLEILKDSFTCFPFIINPREASILTACKAGFDEGQIIKMSRTIDPELLKLNQQGYLNGHTPFSAMLAFASLFTAAVFGIGEIALSNESSANEPSIPGTSINHQYSKSMEFEKDFRQYEAEYIRSGIEYYSFLRPLNELQISGLFAGMEKYHQSFRSCNAGSKTNTWCGECPKCLFTCIMLSAFLNEAKLTAIFGEELLEKEKLAPVLDQLCGFAKEKPFDCVGTVDEVNAAIQKIIPERNPAGLPVLLQRYIALAADRPYDPSAMNAMLKAFHENCIPDKNKVELLKYRLNAL